MPKIQVKNVYKIFGSSPQKAMALLREDLDKETILKKTGNSVGVNNASFSVEEGEIFVIMGLSGSGKSTLIRCINRLINPTAGEIHIDGENVASCGKAALLNIRRKKVAMVFQNFALLPHRTIESNVAFGLEIQGVDPAKRRDRAMEALRLVGLEHYAGSYAEQLSGGMKQRVGLARALATDPDILLMDEAFSALDPLIRKEMQDELLALQSKMHKTILFITHDLDEALKVGDRIAIMKDGVIVQIGTPEDILTSPADDYVREFVQDVNRARVLTASSVMIQPRAVAFAWDGVHVAVRKMRDASISSIFVVDKERRLKGSIEIEEAVRLIQSGAENKSMDSILHTDVCRVPPDTLVKEILPLVVSSRAPVAVVDDGGILQGIILKISVLTGISGEEVS